MQIQTSYATASAGMHPSHTLPSKLRAISEAGFKWTEIALPDLEKYASSSSHGYKELDSSGTGDIGKLLDAAKDIRKLCDQLGLCVLTVMPFSQFEGYDDASKLEQGLNRARTWFKVLKALRCRTLQVGSSNDPSISSDYDLMAKNLQALAEEAAVQDPPILIAYEMWAWGIHVNSWEHIFDICRRVNRPNFGLCLDTFQISVTHMASEICLPNALSPSNVPPPSTPLSESLTDLTHMLSQHTDKIFYLQISDGSRIDPHALEAEAKAQGIHPLYAYSNAYRPLPFQKVSRPGFLPVLDVICAVLATGWRGPWSYEVFYAEDQNRDDPDVPRRWTRDAMDSHARILAELAVSQK
ncbi:xylose isomerase-like protein [Fomitiporia mediterranea MF3/22]|uniref:xylose isomerase-like protein n=1 Tax=Fomitiporia mediterranea (strain MF3/22) TaxID=694068 RepID=UPI000440824B|nr:xylose isomerase-like protein [Fomitiporia mediterranea MF3/22]EJC99142.1 xylose isomerase-like protein [Fomitiporia mediterranea MF3/22]